MSTYRSATGLAVEPRSGLTDDRSDRQWAQWVGAAYTMMFWGGENSRMTTQQQPLQEAFHFTVLREHDPELYDLAQRVRGHVMTDGALSAKIKTLMAMLCDAMRDRHAAIPVLAGVARAQGATDDEIAETMAVAYWIGGVHALNTAAEAFRR